jgi:hypothetical protein
LVLTERGGVDALSPGLMLPKIELADKGFDDTNWIIFSRIVFKRFRQ